MLASASSNLETTALANLKIGVGCLGSSDALEFNLDEALGLSAAVAEWMKGNKHAPSDRKLNSVEEKCIRSSLVFLLASSEESVGKKTKQKVFEAWQGKKNISSGRLRRLRRAEAIR